MGWGRTFFLGDIGNRLDISDCEQDIQVLKESLMQFHQEGQSQDAELMVVQRENDQLKLYIAALVRLLTGKGVLGADEIRKMVEIIDSEDAVKRNPIWHNVRLSGIGRAKPKLGGIRVEFCGTYGVSVGA